MSYAVLLKHLQGKHDQHSHGRGTAGGNVIDALSKIEKLPTLAGYGQDQVKAPFAYEPFTDFRARTRKLIKGQPRQAVVAIDRLKVMQETVFKNKLIRMVTNFQTGASDEPLLVLSDGKTLLVRDGTHRLSALKLLGVKTAEVEIVDYK